MKKALLVSIMALVFGYVFAVLIPVNPVEQRPGTRLSGYLADTPVSDWSSLEARAQVFLQANTWYGIPHSVTVLGLTHQGELFIPCAKCPTKRWPGLVAADPAVVIKAGEYLHQGTLQRITDKATVHAVFGDADHARLAGVYLYRFTQ